jgi:hypothetical protein
MQGFSGFDFVLEGREASAALMSGSATSIHKDDQRQRLELVIFGRPGAEDHQPRERGGASASDLPSVRKPVVCRDGVLACCAEYRRPMACVGGLALARSVRVGGSLDGRAEPVPARRGPARRPCRYGP